MEARIRELHEKKWTLEARLRVTVAPLGKKKTREQIKELEKMIKLNKKVRGK